MISGESFKEGSAGKVHFPNISADDFRLFLRLFKTPAEGSWDLCLVCERCDTNSSCRNDGIDSDGHNNNGGNIGGKINPSCESENEFGENHSGGDKDKASGVGPSSSDSGNFEFHRVDDCLKSLVSVLQFAHQYLVHDLSGGGDGGDCHSATAHNDPASGYCLERLFHLLARLIVHHSEFVRMSTLWQLLSFLDLIIGGDSKDEARSGIPHYG